MNDIISRVAASMDRMNRCEAAEIQKLCAEPDYHLLATRLTDAMLAGLIRLCNYHFITDGVGKQHDIQDVIRELETDIRATFKQLTGHDYEPEIVRYLQREGK